jgi:5-oxoprolinase (ATP-hydrolysing)
LRTSAESPAAQAAGWHIWIDRGGTFTDVVALNPRGQILVRKVLSVQPGISGDPAVQAITELLGPSDRVADLRLGTTVATNALLEGAGTPVLLLINRGLGDLLRIGDLHRPDLFALAVRRPDPLAMRVVEVGGRLAADGVELEPLALDQQLRQSIGDALADGYRSVAIALLHSTRNPDHELQLADWLAPLAPDTITLSHRLSALPRLVPRGHTALVEAAVAPVLGRYLDQVEQALGDGVPLRIMRSSGALAPRPWLQAKDTVFSGPAGGMVGAIAVAHEALQHAGLPLQPVVGFDMGGTSTDVFHAGCRDGVLHWQRSPETAIAGLQLQAPMLPIHTVAAGGGSILRFDDGRLQVGPASAGADPGPAAYRRGGPLTITDANVLLGRLPAEALPPLFGANGDQPLDRNAVQQGFAVLQAAMARAGVAVSVEELADGALRIAVETMAAAIRRISLEQGHDPRAAVLVSYGGAAAQHACRLAAELGIQRVLVHPLAGVLSAVAGAGGGVAPESADVGGLARPGW